MNNYSVLMSVYRNDNPNFLRESIESIMNQTIQTNDFVIIKDGKLTSELDFIILKFKNMYPDIFNIVELAENVGLGKALSIGIAYCKNEFVARMDADDFSIKDRIEKELNYLENHVDVDLIGTQSYEFNNDVNVPVQYNTFPIEHENIVKYAHSRNPYSHPSVVFKKSKVLEAGNYQDAYLCEDYDLWIRMIQNGSKCANLDEYLFAVRISDDFFKRRGGIKYVSSINNLMKRNMKNGFFTKKDYIKNIAVRSTVYLMPNNLRSFVYTKFLRKGKVINEEKNFAHSS